MAACGAKTRSAGKCKRSGTGAGGRCKFHGGASLAGPAHPNWKTGRHSKYLPTNLAGRYAESVNDPDLTSLRDDLALADGRVTELLESLGQSGSTKLWMEARQRFDAFKAAGKRGRDAVGAARVAIQQLDDTLTAGLAAAVTWDELRETLELRRKLSESETKRMKDLHQMISAGAALGLMAQLVEVVAKNVTDRTALAAITQEYLRLTARGSSETAPT
jgi:hypothetical protein